MNIANKKHMLTFVNNIHNKHVTKTIALCAIVIIAVIFNSCVAGPVEQSKTDLLYTKTGDEIYQNLMAQVEANGQTIPYDTLVDVNKTVSDYSCQIPHKDRLLKVLIYKRHPDTRVDQMILIFAARMIGESKCVVSDAFGIFESILHMDDNRINEWVISYVAEAVGDYPFELSNGDRLADMLEAKLDQVWSLSGNREYFGFHFMPPPKSDFIRLYIEGIENQKVRESERTNYYTLIHNHVDEINIEGAVQYLQKYGDPETGEKITRPIKYVLLNIKHIFYQIEKNKRVSEK